MIKTVDGQKGIQCLLCGLTSFNYNDITNKYCGHCHIFHEDSLPADKEKEIVRAIEEAIARAVKVKNLFNKYF